MGNRLRIAILRLGTLGDLILSTPMFKYIKEKYPDSFLTLIAGKRNKEVVTSNPFIDELIIWDKSPFVLPRIIWEIKKKKFDFYIDPKDHFSREGFFILKLVNAETKIGFNPKGKSIFNFSIPPSTENKGLHYTQIVFNSLQPLNISLENSETVPKPQLFISNDSNLYVESYLKKINCNDKNFIIINISASNPNKMIPIDRLIDAIRRSFLANLTICKILTFTKNHKKFAKKVIKAIPQISPFSSRNFNDIVALVNKAKAIITPDTSIVHICTAFEKPILAFYSGLDEFFIKFKPINPKALIIRAKEGDNGLHTISTQQIISSINLFFTNLKEIL